MPKKPAAKPKLVLDSNVLISAVVFGGKPREVLELAVKGRVEIAVSDAILDEVRGVLRGRKFQYPESIVHALIGEIEELSDFVEPGERSCAIRDDPEDDRVLECAVASGADFIVTGDSHLLALRSFRQMRIMNPDEFLRL